MARITCTDPAELTGHVGPVRFVDGEGETEDAELLAFFGDNPDRFTVHDDTEHTEHTDTPTPDPVPVTPAPTPRPPRRT